MNVDEPGLVVVINGLNTVAALGISGFLGITDYFGLGVLYAVAFVAGSIALQVMMQEWSRPKTIESAIVINTFAKLGLNIALFCLLVLW